MELETHKKLGALLKEAMGILNQECLGTPKKKHFYRYHGTWLKLDKVRCHLDDVVIMEYPELSNEEFLNIYYTHSLKPHQLLNESQP